MSSLRFFGFGFIAASAAAPSASASYVGCIFLKTPAIQRRPQAIAKRMYAESPHRTRPDSSLYPRWERLYRSRLAHFVLCRPPERGAYNRAAGHSVLVRHRILRQLRPHPMSHSVCFICLLSSHKLQGQPAVELRPMRCGVVDWWLLVWMNNAFEWYILQWIQMWELARQACRVATTDLVSPSVDPSSKSQRSASSR